MAWFADLAGKAESLLNNLDEQTGAALRNHTVTRRKRENNVADYGVTVDSETPWLPKKRPISRKKASPIPDTKVIYSTNRRSSPISHYQARQLTDQNTSRNGPSKSKKSPSRKSSPDRQYNLHNCPETLVGDIKDNDVLIDHLGIKQRRFSLPSDLELLSREDWTYKLQSLDIENCMLRNELSVMNREVTDLLDKLHRTEDGNDLDSTELAKTRIKMDNTDVINHRMNLDKQSLTTQVELLKRKIIEHTNAEIASYKEQKQLFESENNALKSRNGELEDRLKQMNEKARERDNAQIKLENDLRHAQSTVTTLQGNLEKTTEECRRLERDWEAYKVRVKNMLLSKDTEIKTLQDGLNVNEDTKILTEQIENLRDERDDLSDAVSAIRLECSEMKTYLKQVEAQHSASERVVAALRDALREERAARNRAEAQSIVVAKEMKAMQMETGQTLSSLQSQLREKEDELRHLREISSTARITDTSALNVADYDVMQDTIENNKLSHLTEKLVQKQTKIDHLLGQNNMLRIQLEKLETKLKLEAASRKNNYHSVVHLQEAETRNRRLHPPSSLTTLPLRLGLGLVKRYPALWLFIIIYMVGLHLWVLTVLWQSTPENYVSSRS